MALTQPSNIYGIHSAAFYNNTTGVPYGIYKVLGALEFSNTRERIPLTGGSLAYNWDEQPGRSDATLTLTVREIKALSFQIFQGDTPTERSAESGGGVVALANQYGTTAMSATIGVATATVKAGSESDLKSGMYIVKVVSATTVDVYALTDVSFNVGTDLTFQDDTLKITASPLTITASTAVEIPNTGIELTGGSGTIGMTAGDTAYFYVREINTGSFTAQVDALDTAPEFGGFFVAQRQTNGKLYMLEVPRIQSGSLPMNFTEFDWSETSHEMSPLYDSTKGYIYKFDEIKAVNA